MTKQDHISRVWDIIDKARVGMLPTRFAGGLRARLSQTSSEFFAAAKTAFGTTFHSPDVEATQYGMARWNKSVRLQLYS
jgi:hypothetical protein